MKQIFFYAILTIILACSMCFGQETLKLNQEARFSLRNKEEKTFTLELKKGEYAEIGWQDSLDRFPSFLVISPSGKSVTEGIYEENPLPFVAKEDGRYKLLVRFEETENNQNGDVSVSYNNVFKLPESAKLKRQKNINGYNIAVYNTDESGKPGYGTYLLIKKGGKLLEILRGGTTIGDGFNFGENSVDEAYLEGKKSARLIRATLDKTCDGTPDIAVQFWTGGAHCCFDTHFYELGRDGVRKLKTIEGKDTDILAIGKNAKGGLILRTGDSTFAYWQTSFAGSPIPTVILTYQNGEFRPDLKLMKKAAPSIKVLQQKAAQAKKELGLEPYNGEEILHFVDPFWGEMLDLMYSGNETAAWQYFDLVWDARKPGKEKFKQDFLRKLNESEFWQMMRAGHW